MVCGVPIEKIAGRRRKRMDNMSVWEWAVQRGSKGAPLLRGEPNGFEHISGKKTSVVVTM